MVWYQDGHHRELVEEIGDQVVNFVKSHRRRKSLIEKLLLTPHRDQEDRHSRT